MPNYDMKCNDCNKEFSVFCAISQKDKQVCPNCKSENLETVFKQVNIGRPSDYGPHSHSGG